MTQILDVVTEYSFYAFLWIFAFWIYPEFRVTQFRQQMFALRDELFDLAASGQISFSDDAYKGLRMTANGFIRFAHIMSISHVMISGLFLRRRLGRNNRQKFKLQENLSHLPKESAAIYLQFQEKMNSLVIRYLLLGSPLFFFTIIFVLPASAYAIISRWLDIVKLKLRSPIENMDAVAYVAASEGAYHARKA